MNIVILHGRLTADPVIRQSNSGKAIAGFSVAVDGYKDKDGNKQTDFIRCSAFGQTAELMGRYFTKGKEIAVEGSLHPNDYTDDKGVKHFSYQVNVNRVHFCGRKADNQQAGQQQNSTPAQQNNSVDFGEYEEVIGDGEIPF